MFFKIKETSEILKQIFGIILALAFTNSVIVFILDNGVAKSPISLENYSVLSSLMFIALIIGIIRFFHGNINYLTNTYNLSDFQAQKGKLDIRLALDFIVLFMQALLFCALSFYQNSYYDFFLLFSVLFTVDSLWFFLVWKKEEYLKREVGFEISDEDNRTRINWMVTNFITAIIMWILLLSKPQYVFWCLCGIIYVNTILDYSLNWNMYFPRMPEKTDDKISAFLAARFTSAIDDQRNFERGLKNTIERIQEVINSCGYQLYSSHKDEEFGNELVASDTFIERDLKQISSANLFIALLDNKLSSGVCVELGWASLLGKKMILIVEEDFDLNEVPMIKSLGVISRNEILRYNDLKELEKELRDRIKFRYSLTK